jgi:23S rRNA (cytosine1962-C5)-methyltransferase
VGQATAERAAALPSTSVTADHADYRLLDAGNARRLEVFGDRVVDRPAPSALEPPRDLAAWRTAGLRYTRETGWRGDAAALAPWPIELGRLRLELRPTASGQVGLYPEHLANLPWLADQVRAADEAPPRILNLFASTGLATLALAAAGAAVVHVDAARSAVAWARRNADLSGLGDRPIRWIVDDAAGFVAREVRRGRRYDGVVLDPPSWGHGDEGQAWRLDARLTELLEGCAVLASRGRAFCLLTTHTTGRSAGAMATLLAAAFDRSRGSVEAGAMELHAVSGARLSLGWYARLAP